MLQEEEKTSSMRRGVEWYSHGLGWGAVTPREEEEGEWGMTFGGRRPREESCGALFFFSLQERRIERKTYMVV